MGGFWASLYYRHKRDRYAVDSAKRIREIAEAMFRWGYRRIHVMLRREGLDDKRQARASAVLSGRAASAQQALKRKVSAKLRSDRTQANRQDEV